MRLCSRLQWSGPPTPSSPLSPAAASRLFELSWRCTEAAFLSSLPPKRQLLLLRLRLHSGTGTGTGRHSVHAVCGLWDNLLCEKSYSRDLFASECPQRTQQSHTRIRNRDRDRERNWDRNRIRVSIGIGIEIGIGVGTARWGLLSPGQVGQLADDSCQRETAGESQRERERGRADCGGALMWVQFQYKHKHKGRKHT